MYRLAGSSTTDAATSSVWEFKGAKSVTVKVGSHTLRLVSASGDLTLKFNTSGIVGVDQATGLGSVGFHAMLSNGKAQGTAEMSDRALATLSKTRDTEPLIEVTQTDWRSIPLSSSTVIARGKAGFPDVTVQLD